MVVDFAGHGGEQIVLKNDVLLPVMQFRVTKGAVKDTSSLPLALRDVPRIAESEAVKTRQLSINDYPDIGGNRC